MSGTPTGSGIDRASGTAVQDWLTEHLIRAYQLSERAARQVVAARMVLPLIDGLD